MRRTGLHIIFFFAFYLLSINFGLSQQAINDRVKVQYVFTFGRMFDWKDQKQLDTFRIATYGKDTAIFHLLKSFSVIKRLKRKPVKFIHYTKIKDITNPQILYLERSNNNEIHKVYKAITGKNILLVTDSLKKEQETMLNFLPIIIVRLQINQMNVEKEGFKVPPLLAAFSASYKQDWEELFNLSEDSLNKAKEIVNQQKLTLEKQQKQIEKKQQEISALSDTLQKQLALVKKKEAMLKSLSLQIEQQKADLATKGRIVKRQERKINGQLKKMHEFEKKLSNKQKDLQMQTAILAKQKKDIKQQDTYIQQQKNQINQAVATIQKQKLINYFVIVLSVILLFFVVFILYHYLNKRKANRVLEVKNTHIRQQNEEILSQRDEIESQRDEIQAQRDTVTVQKNEIEKVHEELRDSIFYAQRIQNALLPDQTNIHERFSDHFIFFKPKDIVSGDFFWWSFVEVDNTTVIAVSDCTGHGIPGGFMSMLGISLLREIVNKEYVTHPGVILRKMRREIIKSLKQELDNDINLSRMKDGMDMALISINHETNELQFAGANNPLYIIKPVIADKQKKHSNLSDKTVIARRNDEAISPNNEQIVTPPPSAHNDDLILAMTNNDYGLYEVKPDKMPIAIYERMDKFTNHKIQLEKGDQLYLFSDGFADQFGGPKGKKFKYKPFKQLIINNCQLTMSEQKEALEKSFNEWIQGYEQVDDVTVVGIKI